MRNASVHTAVIDKHKSNMCCFVSPPGGGEFPYKEDGGTRRNFKKEPLQGTNNLFCGRDLTFFHP